MTTNHLARYSFITSQIIKIVFNSALLLIGILGLLTENTDLYEKPGIRNEYADVYIMLCILIIVNTMFPLLSFFKLKINDWKYQKKAITIFNIIILTFLLIRVL